LYWDLQLGQKDKLRTRQNPFHPDLKDINKIEKDQNPKKLSEKHKKNK